MRQQLVLVDQPMLTTASVRWGMNQLRRRVVLHTYIAYLHPHRKSDIFTGTSS